MNTQINQGIAVEFIPNSNAFSTFLDMVGKISFPTELIKVLSHIDCNKFNPFEKEYVKKMAIQTAFDYKDAVNSQAVEMAFKNCDVDCEFIADIDYKVASLINENDLKMFD